MTRIRVHRDACACDWCEEGRALGRAMAHAQHARSWHELARFLPPEDWHALVRVLVLRHDWGGSFTSRLAVLRAKLRWEWPHVGRVRIQEGSP